MALHIVNHLYLRMKRRERLKYVADDLAYVNCNFFFVTNQNKCFGNGVCVLLAFCQIWRVEKLVRNTCVFLEVHGL